MSEAKNEFKEAPLPFKAIFTYNLPTVGIGFMFFIVALYLMKFSTDVLLISPAIMGLIFGISRIWDAVTDPLAGYFSDRTTLKSGRRKSWIFASIIPVCASFYMMWNPPTSLSNWETTLWMGAAVLMFYTSMTIFVVPHTSLGAELSLNYHERTKIFGWRHMLWNTGSLFALVAMFLLIDSNQSPENAIVVTNSSPREVASFMTLIAVVVTAVLILWMASKIKERKEFQGRGETNPLTAFKDVWGNKHAKLLLIVFLIESSGGATIGILTPYIAEYVVGRPEHTVFYILAYLIPSIASVPLWIPISKKVGKKAMWMFSMFVTAFGFGGMFFLTEGSVILITVLAVICGLGAGSGAVVAPSIQSDIIDYDEVQSGKRKEGIYFAAWNLVYKSATGFTLMLTGFVLSASGFVPNIEQTEETKTALLALYALFPLVCYTVGAIIFSRFSLNEKEYVTIREELDSRHAAAQSS